MAEIKGFKGLRYTKKAGDMASLVCPPYDVISEDERKEYLRCNEYNIIRLELPREGEDPYETAGETLNEWLSEGILAKDDKDSLYIYEEEFEDNGRTMSFKGIIALVKLEEFSKGIILPHEETLPKAKADRFNLMMSTGCNFSQIYSLYIDEKNTTQEYIEKISSGAPEVCITDDSGVTHRLWRTSDESIISAVSADFAERRLYIADGHHRYETAINYRNAMRELGKSQPGGSADYVMMTLVDLNSPGLVVYPTHRVVHDVEGFSAQAVREKSAEYFDIASDLPKEKALKLLQEAYNSSDKAFVFYTSGRFDLFKLKDFEKVCRHSTICREVMELDVSILHRLVLESAMGIDAARIADQTNVIYTRDIDEAISLTDKGADCAFIMNPTRISQIKDVANVGQKMPQKSTYFYPKLITGLVMNKII